MATMDTSRSGSHEIQDPINSCRQIYEDDPERLEELALRRCLPQEVVDALRRHRSRKTEQISEFQPQV